MAIKRLKEVFGIIQPKTVVSVTGIISVLMAFAAPWFFGKTTFGFAMMFSCSLLAYISYHLYKKVSKS